LGQNWIEEVRTVAQGTGEPVTSESDGVMVLSVWRQGAEGFLGRLTATTPQGGTTVHVVTSPEELLETVRSWLGSVV
jgi:hypothetical protein